MKKPCIPAGAFAAGFLNGLLGTAGGLMLLPAFIKSGMERKKAHATTIAAIFALTLVSTAAYIFANELNAKDALPYIPGGAAGAIFGAWLLKIIPDPLLKKLFAAFMVWAGAKLLLS